MPEYQKPTTKKYEELNKKQKDWIEFYIQTGNATEACRRAGYTGKSNSLKHTGKINQLKLGHFCKKRMEEAHNKNIADTNEILETLTRILRGEEKDAFGLDTTNQDKLKALELIGKANQMYTDKVKQDTSLDINVNLVDDSESDE